MEDLNSMNKNAPIDPNGWGIDKRVPLTFIFVVVVQTIAITWGAAKLDGDVKNYGEKIVKLERDFSHFVEKADTKYLLTESHKDKEQFFKSKLEDVISEVEDLRTRVQDIERTRFTNEMWKNREK